MKKLTFEKKKQLLQEAFWDFDIDGGKLYEILTGKETSPICQRETVLCRLLTCYDWYTLLKLIPLEVLKEALNDKILNRLYPKELKGKYEYARGVLFR